MITRSPSLTDQVKSHIRQRISEGGFEDGRIPPETELATELGVSRITPVITHRFAIDDYGEAFEVMRSGRAGKVILDWN